ncbi:MAG: von Willebrand factor type A domain-containing protein [Micromonosporaceae bacterium]|nr:von Willebrand factor type A domain-containing protein [Micromonosporaceae bacterium]
MRHTTRAAIPAAAAILVLLAACSAQEAAPYAEAPPPSAAENTGFQPEYDAQEQPLSTFAIDIDTASYNYARRRILDGRPVNPDTVRPEEFINAFRQDYRQPPDDGFSITVDGARTPEGYAGAGRYHLMRVGLQTRDVDNTSRPDAALTFVIDVSGSMAEPGRLDLVQDALHYLIDQLRPTDSVAIVAYSEKARVVREMTPVSNRSALHGAVADLAPESSTNLEAGLVLGYRVARDGFVEGATNRVILLSDGLANVGNTDAAPILEKIREEARKQITLLGVGVGSEYGDALMERLADEGDGFVTYVSEVEQARRLFVDRLPATLTVRALDAKVQVAFDPSTVDSYRLVGYDNRVLSEEDFRDDRVDGGEVGPGHSVTALCLVRLHENATAGPVAEVRVRWLDPTTREPTEAASAITVSELDVPFDTASPRLRVSYVAGFFAEVLRESPYGQDVRLEDLAAIAQAASGELEDGAVAELADLIWQAQRLLD